MSRKGWKQHERDTARLFGGKRHPANQGGRVDVTGPVALVQCKQMKTLSLAAIERLAVEMAALGKRQMMTVTVRMPPNGPRSELDVADPRAGVVVVKRSAKSGTPTPALVVMTAEVFAAFYRRDDEGGRDPNYKFIQRRKP